MNLHCQLRVFARRPPSGRAGLSVVLLGFVLVCNSVALTGPTNSLTKAVQETNAPGPASASLATNDVEPPDDNGQTIDTAATNDVMAPEELIDQTNSPAATNVPAKTIPRPRTRRESQRSAAQRRAASQANHSTQTTDSESDHESTDTAARSESGVSSPQFSNFKLIADRNIFDPNRSPRRRGGSSTPARQPKTFDSFTLVGIIAYEKGTFAFFDGSSPDYKKALKQSDVIAGFKLANVGPDAVTLAAGTNHMELRVGAQLRREEEGVWIPVAVSETYAASSSSASASSTRSDSAAGGDESEILKRLRQRKEQE